MKQREGQIAGAIEPKAAAEPPLGLSVGAEKLWNDAVRDFHFGCGELPLLEAACRAWGRAEQARAVLDAEGIVTTSDSGMQHPHPAVRIERDSIREFRLCWAKLGMVDPGAGR